MNETEEAIRRRLLNLAACADAREGIRQGLEDAECGNLRPVLEFSQSLKPHIQNSLL